MIKKSKIVLVTTVVNFDLYKKTALLFPGDIDKVAIDGTTGLYGLESIKLIFEEKKFNKYDWIVMVDEDVFFYDSNLIYELILNMDKQGYGVCGIRDGGVIKHRFNNPIAINTFFCILNYKEIKKDFKYNEIIKFQKFIPELYKNEDYTKLCYEYNINSLKEPYYCFYFWLKIKGFKFLYLNSINPVKEDEIGNIILNQNNEEIGFHSWYARAYNVYEDQTLRINTIINEFGLDKKFINVNEFVIIRVLFYNWRKRFKKSIKNLFLK